MIFSRFLCLRNDQTERIPGFAGLLQLPVTIGSHEPLRAVIQIPISVIRHQRQCLFERETWRTSGNILFASRATSAAAFWSCWGCFGLAIVYGI